MNRMYAAYGYTDYITPQYYVPSGYRGVSHILLDVDDTLMETYTNLLATYEEQQDQIEAGEEVTEELVTLEQVEAAKQAIIDSVQPTIDEINQKLADGVSFDELIQEYGTDPGMQDAATRAEGYPCIWTPPTGMRRSPRARSRWRRLVTSANRLSAAMACISSSMSVTCLPARWSWILT